ncbi:MAG TPA: TolC family protein [Candidatus Sulfopaludibacter sp.]|nr:TolC family protein [Candidatus Sulfopaludibacter sp.]
MRSRMLLLFTLAVAAHAQGTVPLALTLKDAVGLALKQNPQVILANLSVSQSEQDRLLARSTLLPQVYGTAGEGVHRINIETAIGVAFPNFPQHVGPFYVSQAGVQFSLPVFDLTLWNRYRSSKIGIDADRAQERSAREESVMLVVSQYLGAQRAAADVEAVQSRVDLAQALYNQAADLQKNGAGTAIDTLRANVQLQNEKQRLIVARTSFDTALFALGRLLSIDPHRPIELADRVSFFETPPVSAGQTIERAYAARPELAQLRAQEQRASLELKTAGDERLPKLTLSGVWLEQGLTPASAIPVYQYEANLDFPLFTGGRIQAERARAELAIRQLQQQEQEARNRIALEVKNAVAHLDSARGEVDVARLGVDLAGQEVEQARDRFQAGVANNIEVITAQDELSRANDNQIAALYRYNQARADLAYASGQMEAVYAR